VDQLTRLCLVVSDLNEQLRMLDTEDTMSPYVESLDSLFYALVDYVLSLDEAV